MPPELPPPRTALRLPRFNPSASDHAWRRTLLALAVAAMGVIDLLSALLSHPPDRVRALQRLVPTEILDTSRTFTLLAGALLLVTAWGLRRGKRRAFITALFLCALSVPVNMLKAFDIEEATVASALMFLLGVSADAFRVQSRALSLTMLRSRATWAVVTLLLYIFAGSWIMSALFGVEASVARAFADAAHRLFGIGHPVVVVPQHLPYADHRMITWYLRSVPILSVVLVVSLGLAALRPAQHQGRHRADASRVRELLMQYGASSVSWFALDDDADYFFSRTGRAVIAYRFESDTLLAIGDPIGPADEWRSVLRDFESYCRSRDWRFAFYQARAESLPPYLEMGWRALHIGEDPVIALDQFSLDGGAIGSVRRSSRKAEVAGIVVRHWVPGETPFDAAGAPPGWIDEMRTISQEWLRGRPGGEKGFCMGRFDPRALAETWITVAWNERAQRIEAFASWVPIPARKGWALDLTRRRPDAAAGTMELMVVRTVEVARARGDALLSLSLSALAKVDEPADAPARALEGEGPEPDRARQFLMQHLSRFYDFKGLFHWKKKFDPAFEDRYLVYPNAIQLPGITLALVRAQTPGGLLSYVEGWLPKKPRAEAPEEADGSAAESA